MEDKELYDLFVIILCFLIKIVVRVKGRIDI